MSGHHFGSEAIASVVFLVLYVLVFLWMVFGFITSKFPIKSRWGFLFFHVVVRIASQACGVAFGILGFSNISLFTAYLILSAEGFFTLVLVCSRFLVAWHEHNRFNGQSFLEPRSDASGERKVTPFQYGTLQPLFWIVKSPGKILEQPLSFWHTLLTIGNALIIAGGSILKNTIDVNNSESVAERQDDAHTGRSLRIAGQAIFLAFSIFLGLCITYTLSELARRRDATGTRKSHPSINLIFLAWLFLLVRGIWGVLQASVHSLSYFSSGNYNEDGYTDRYVVLENVLGVVTEWIPVLLFNLTWATSRHDPPKRALNGDSESDENKSLDETPSRSQRYGA